MLLYYHAVTRQCASNGDTLVLTFAKDGNNSVSFRAVYFEFVNRIKHRGIELALEGVWLVVHILLICVPYGVEVYLREKPGVISTL